MTLTVHAVSLPALRCQGKVACHIQASNRMFGDPCHLNPKYLEVQYLCQSGNALFTRSR